MKVLFLHGWFSTGAAKTAFLRSLGYNVLNPRLSNWSFWRAVRTAQQAFNDFRPSVVVGSSRGGAIAMNMNTGDTPLILLAPAWRRFGKARQVKPGCILIHSPHDDSVPFDDGVTLSKKTPGVMLVVAGKNHRLNCAEGRDALKWALESLVGHRKITNSES